MRIPKPISCLLVLVIFSTTVPAADPPAGGEAPKKPGVSMMVPPEFDMNQLSDPAAAVEKARELRKLADKGDADATYNFAMLLAYYQSGQGSMDGKQLAELRKLQGPIPISDWLLKAAERGSQPAIEGVCRAGADRLAPADIREQGKARCDELRAKHPAP